MASLAKGVAGRSAGQTSCRLSSVPIALSVLLLILSSFRTSDAIWWDRRADDSLERIHAKHCPEKANATASMQLCRLTRQEIASLVQGARTGIAVCQLHASNKRWNCSSSNWNVFLAKLHKEAAYVHAVISVAVSWQLVHDCNNGELTDTPICSGTINCEGRSCTKEIISYGYNTAKILDWLHDPDQLTQMKKRQAIVHNHNRDVGRFLVKRHIKKMCKCQGVSASCLEMRCFHQLPTVEVMIHNLTHNFQMLPWKFARHNVNAAVKALRRQAHGRSTLIHMKKSPSYCCNDPSQGIAGTEGRVCYGRESCKKICCSAKVEEITNDVCNCKFIYCCKLKCERCPNRVYRCIKPSPATCGEARRSSSEAEL